jgi:hypothetical protein
MSLARRHRERHRAAQAGDGALRPRDPAQPAPMPTTGPVASEYALLLAALGQDLATLRTIQSVERKIVAKAGMIGRYRAWLAGALAASPPVQDDIVGTMLVWAIDIADWPLALELGDHVLAARLALPERYKRGAAVLLAEEVAESALRVGGRSARGPRGDAGPHRRPRHARSGPRQAHKAIGLAFQAEAEAFDPEAESQRAGGKRALVDAALTHLTRALELDGSAGVKKAVERLTADLKKLSSPDTRLRHPRRGGNGREASAPSPAPSPPPLLERPSA